MKSIEVEILGKQYRLRADNVDKVKEYASYLNNLLEEISSKYGIVDNKDSLVLASMILAEKLFTITTESEKLREEIALLNSKISSFIVELNN